MKQLNLIITSTVAAVLLSACGGSTGVAPSQNDALNSISNSKGKEKSGYMQKSLDSWLKDDWTPTVEKNEEIREKYMEKVSVEDEKGEVVTSTETTEVVAQKETQTKTKYVEKKDKSFTLQEYVDKAGAYLEVQESNPEESNVEKMNKMPVIGN